MNEHVESLGQVKATVVDLAIRFGPKVFVAVVIVLRRIFPQEMQPGHPQRALCMWQQCLEALRALRGEYD